VECGHSGPRLGIAWDRFGDHKTAVRTGFGICDDRYQDNRVFDFVRNPPLGIQPTLTYGLMKDINQTSAPLSPPAFYASAGPRNHFPPRIHPPRIPAKQSQWSILAGT